MKSRTLEIGSPEPQIETINRTMNIRELSWDWHITKIEIPLTDVLDGASMTITLRNNTTTETKEAVINGDTAFAEFDFYVPKGGNVRIDILKSNCNYYDLASGAQKIFGATISFGGTDYWINMDITVEYEPLMSPNRYTDGYLTDITEEDISWHGFTKNENGYPLNNGVWKQDTQNDGYLWITGYDIPTERGDRILVMSNKKWVSAKCVIFSKTELTRAYVKVFENGG